MLTGDLFVFGDVRDVVREGWNGLRGEEVDKVVLGLAGTGIAVTAGLYATRRPGRAGARRTVGREGGAPRRIHRRAAAAPAQGGDARRTDALRRQPRKSAVESRPARRPRRIEGGRTSEGHGEARAPCRRQGHQDARDREAARPRRHRAHRRAVRSRAVDLLGAAQSSGVLRGLQARGRAHDLAPLRAAADEEVARLGSGRAAA